jgi:hypothetical protein
MNRFFSIFNGRLSFIFGNCPKQVVSALVLPIACMAMTGCTTTHFATIGEDVSPSITSFSASPTPVQAGASTTLSWTTSKADSVIVTPGDSEPLSADGSIVLSPAETTTYTLTAINSVGSKTATATVTVAAVNANTIGSFTASPTSIGPGGSSKLSWTSTGAARVAITPGTFTSTSASGSTTVSPTATTTYKLTATNEAGGEVGTANATVNVMQGAVLPVVNSFTASPTGLSAGGSSMLSWATTGATAVTISPGTFTSASASGSTTVSPMATTTYTLTASNAAGSVQATVTVAVQAATLPVINSFTASSASISVGGSSTLNWSTTGATGVAITPGTFTSGSASGSRTVSPTATATYTLTASNVAGSVKATVTVAVQAATLPVIKSFTASSASISVGGSSTLNWSTTGATGVAITPGTFTSASASGSRTVSPTATATYTLSASNAAGSVKATVTIVVQAANLPLINSFTASSASISVGGSSTLNWSTTGATGVAITPGTFTSASASGSRTVIPTATATYTLTASNAAGSVKATVTVAVQAATLPVINSFTASSASISVGGSITLNWSTTGATGVAITPGTFTSASASGSRTVSPTATTTYTLTATNSAGSVKTTVRVAVQAATLPVINSFTASSASISVGGSSTLNWSTTGATAVTITPGTFTSASTSGSTTVRPTSTSTYTLTATNSAGSVKTTVTVAVQAAPLPVINSFAASPASISSGSSSKLSWTTSGATRVAITPGMFTSTSASGSTTVNPTASTTYTLTATNTAGSTTATAKVTVATASSALTITTSSCPGGTQNAGYAGCTIAVSGGTPPYTFSVSSSASHPPLPEGMALNASTGVISSALIGGQGTYVPELVVTDSKGAEATQTVTFSINGSNAFLESVFSSDSIFHHRVDALTTGLPVDTSPAGPLFSGYLSSTIRPFFGSGGTFPNGIPAIEVPWNQPDVSVATTEFQSYFTSGPIPDYAPVEGTSNSTGDRHVLVYRQAGNGTNPALYEMWQGIYKEGPWTDSSNALWPDASSDNLTPQGMGTSDAAGLPVSPLLVNADEVIGTGNAAEPNGAVRHPVRFTVNHMLKYWVWPATSTAGVGSCKSSTGETISTPSEISQSSPPASCTMSGAAGEIYRLKATVATPACAATSPQAAIIITGFRDYGIILADNGETGGLIGTPDARWNDADLACLESLTLGDFEPVNVSSLIVSNSSGQTSH